MTVALLQQIPFSFSIFSRFPKEMSCRSISGFTVELDNQDRITKLVLGIFGCVEYKYDEDLLLEITHHTKEVGFLYAQDYEYNFKQKAIAEKLIGNLDEITYASINNSENPILVMTSPIHREKYHYNLQGQLLIHENNYKDVSYKIDHLGRGISQTSHNSLTKYQYNDNTQLLSTTKITFTVIYTYGDLGERLSKTILKDNK